MTSTVQPGAMEGLRRLLRGELPEPAPRPWEDLAVAVSLTNLCYLRSWGELRIAGRSEYLTQTPAGRTLELATLASVVLLGVVLFACFRLVRSLLRRRGSLALDALVFCALFCVLFRTFTDVATLAMLFGQAAATGIVAFLARLSGFLGAYGDCVAVVLVCSGALLVFLRRPRPTLQWSRRLVLVVSPWFIINAGLALWHSPGNVHADNRAASRAIPGSRKAPRVVWLVFDELDQDLAFGDRPAGVKLPVFDSLRAQALWAGNASAPAANTLESMPSLITGRVVSQAVPNGDELRLTFDDGAQGAWSREGNVFKAARQLGFNSALAGWFHPYCSVLADSLTECFSASGDRWVPSRRFSNYSESIGFWKTLLFENAREFSLGPTYKRFDGTVFSELDRQLARDMRAAHLAAFLEFREKAHAFLADPDLSFVCIHVPVPHAPGIFDRKTDLLSLSETSNYLDNLVLADRFLGEVRRTLAEAGDWDNATVLVSSDHPYRPTFWSKQMFWTNEMAQRTAHRRFSAIPFLLKLPRQKASLRYAPAFNTVLTHDLLLAVMRGKIRSAEQASRWLDDHRTAPGPLLLSRK